MANVGIQTDSSTIEKIREELGEDAIQIISPEIDKLNAYIYNCSFKFLKNITPIIEQSNNTRRLENRINQYRNNIIAKKENPDSIDNAVTSYYGHLQQVLRQNQLNETTRKEYYECIMTYQKEMNEILGQTVQMTFVFENTGEIIFMDSKDLVNGYDNEAGKFRYDLDLANNAQIQKTVYDFIEGTNFKIEDTIPLRDTYKEVIWRFRVAKKLKNSSNNRKTNFCMVLYYIKDHWNGVKVSAGGDISQAYANFALNHTFEPFINKERELRVEYFLFGVQNGSQVYKTKSREQIRKWNFGVIGIDNESGFLAGDTSLNSIEYGIKGIGASSLGVKQIFDFAENVVNKKGAFSKDDIEQWKRDANQRASTRNRMYEHINRNLESVVENASNYIEDLLRIESEILYRIRV